MSSIVNQGASTKRGRVFGIPRRLVGVIAALLFAAMLIIHGFFYQTFTVPSGSMEPTYMPGDRILVKAFDIHLHRGDVIVFDGSDSLYQPAPCNGIPHLIDDGAEVLGFHPGQRDYLKRVIGVGGDKVKVDARGTLFINGVPTRESYLPEPTGHASAQPFDVSVPAGELFVMGDNRAASDDSRNHLGDPGGGFVPRDKVIGVVAATYWHG